MNHTADIKGEEPVEDRHAKPLDPEEQEPAPDGWEFEMDNLAARLKDPTFTEAEFLAGLRKIGL